MEGIKGKRFRCAYLKNPVGIDLKNPLLSWNVKGKGQQTAYEVETWKNGKKDRGWNHYFENSIAVLDIDDGRE